MKKKIQNKIVKAATSKQNKNKKLNAGSAREFSTLSINAFKDLTPQEISREFASLPIDKLLDLSGELLNIAIEKLYD